MYLSAQRVQNSRREQGINAFVYAHGNYVWDGSPPLPLLVAPPAQEQLVWSLVSLAPAGNRVRSYLDIIAPDTTSAIALRVAHALAARHELPRTRPAVLQVGPCLLRFDMDDDLRRQWRDELGKLFARALDAHRASPLAR